MIEWLNAVAPLVTLGGVATLIGLIVHFSKEWKDALKAEYGARYAQHKSELAEKDRLIEQLRASTYAGAGKVASDVKSLIDFKDALHDKLKEELDGTRLEEREKGQLLERMNLRFSSEQRVVKAVLDIGSEDPSTSLNAAREILKIRDPRTIPRLVEIMWGEPLPTPTKQIAMRALKEFGEDAVPSLIDKVREHARLVSEDDLSDDPQSEAWRAAVLESDAGKLLVRIGAASIPSLQKLLNNEGLLGEAAGALLSAITERQ